VSKTDLPAAERGQRLERTLSSAVLILLFAGCIAVLWPFKSALLWAVVLCFTTWPVYQRMLQLTRGRRTWAALAMTLLTALVLLLPFVIVGATLADNVRELAGAMRQSFEAGPPGPPTWLLNVPIVGSTAHAYWVDLASGGREIFTDLKGLVEPASTALLTAGLVIGRGLIDLTLSILIAFFLYRDGGWIAARARGAATRLAGARGEHLLVLAGNTIRGVVFGILGTALVQGVMAGVGLLVARVPGAVALGLLTFLLSPLPVGPPLVWGSATAWLFYRGQIGWGIFMLIWGLLISSVDNVVKPWLISKGSDMPFLLIFMGVIGGALAFGFIGVFLGPTLLAVGYRLLHEWLLPPAQSPSAPATAEVQPLATPEVISHAP
jgi:predicted PurR-regulated permease PerM